MFFFNKTPAKSFIEKQFYVLGTIISLKVYGNKAEKAIIEAVTKLYEIDDKMSVFKESSEISAINKRAGISPVNVSEETFYVVEKAVNYSVLSMGTYDPTIRPVIDLWGFGRGKHLIPDNKTLTSKLQLVNFKDILLDKKAGTIMLRQEGQSLDLGGIAKGYAADAVSYVLRKNRIKKAIIDLGGNIYAYGKRPDNSLWSIGIQDPLNNTGVYIGAIQASNKSVVTSGNYERFFTSGGKRYHHIIDPRTGYPAESGIISSTIISDHSIDADGLSTPTLIMGLENSTNLVNLVPGVDAAFITEDKSLYVTSGLKDSFKLFDPSYNNIIYI